MGGNYHKLPHMLIDRPYIQIKCHLDGTFFIEPLRGLGMGICL